ncbi:MAG: gamma-glutamyltransferase family protein [Acidimicrobiia bacterium]|nr:gamma-glutamyltransferase family protein [Acidimicrobiia bacterium]
MARVAIAAGSQIAADAGASAAANGGNAVDAAIAASIASMSTDPGVISLGAGSFIAVWPADADPVVIDAYAEMPGRSAPPDRFGTGAQEIHMAYGGGMTSIVGYGSIATPGSVRGFGEASRLFGTIDWSELVEPTVYLAEEGFPLSGAAAEYMTYSHDVIYGWHPETAKALHHPDGSHLKEGETVHIEGMADSLAHIAANGPDSFYTGDIGQAMAEAIVGNGGLVDIDDLREYEAIIREPLRVPLGEWGFATNPAPAIGGATVAAVLQLITDVDAWDGAGVKRIAEALDVVLGFRRDKLDRSTDLVRDIAALIESSAGGDPSSVITSPSTVHVSTVDSNGLACAITSSAGYGSGAMIPGTGIMLNNSLGEVELNHAGLHTLAPGTRLSSNMAPSITRNPDGSVLAVGSPGASRITSAVAETVFNFLRLGMPLDAAVAHPRIHVETFEDERTLAYEPGVEIGDIDGLSLRPFSGPSMYFGGVQAAAWDEIGGLSATADPRRTGGIAFAG